MKRRGFRGECWPTEQQELLLRTALLEEPDATRAWHAARADLDPDFSTVAGDSMKLIPLVYRNLIRLGIDDPLVPRLRGIYRRTWYSNQVLFHDVARLLTALRDAGVDTLVLKGAALIERYYGDAGVRPMADVDVLVPYEDARRAVTVLLDLGWTLPKVSLERFMRLRHGIPFEGPDGRRFDLHWRVLKLLDRPGTWESGAFWRGSVEIEIAGVPTRTLNAADHLLHVCAHGMRWRPHVFWPADTATILRNGDIDWERLLRETRRFRSTLLIGDALTYLADVFDAQVPPEVVMELERTPVTARDRYAHRATVRPPKRGRIFRDFPAVFRRYARMSVTWSLPRAAGAFPRHVRDTYELDSVSDLARIAKKALRRTRS